MIALVKLIIGILHCFMHYHFLSQWSQHGNQGKLMHALYHNDEVTSIIANTVILEKTLKELLLFIPSSQFPLLCVPVLLRPLYSGWFACIDVV